MTVSRFRLFDGLRALAAGLVFVDHAWFQFHRSACGFAACSDGGGFLSAAWTAVASGLGGLGVSVFYLISVFLLYRPFVAARLSGGEHDVFGYALRRGFRIFPAYWLALGVVLLVGVGVPVLSGGVLLQLVTLTQVYTLKGLLYNPIPPSWTICVELSFYVFLPIWAVFMRRVTASAPLRLRREVVALVILSGVAACWRIYVVLNPALPSGYRNFLGFVPVSEKLLLGSLDLFAVGMLLALLSASDRLGSLKKLSAVHLWIGASVLYGALAWLTAADGPLAGDWRVQSLVTGWMRIPIAAMLVLPAISDGVSSEAGTEDSGLVQRMLSAKGVAWIGMVSYGIYLWHAPILKWIDRLVGVRHPVPFPEFLGLVLLALGATVGVAAASWYLLEAPINRFARRVNRRGGKPSVPPAA